MIISDEQTRAAIELLKQGPTGAAVGDIQASDEILARAKDAVSMLPETRDDRVEEARERFKDGIPDAQEVVNKMISRIVSDSIR